MVKVLNPEVYKLLRFFLGSFFITGYVHLQVFVVVVSVKRGKKGFTYISNKGKMNVMFASASE